MVLNFENFNFCFEISDDLNNDNCYKVPNKRGGHFLIVNGQLFTKNSETIHSERWYCKEYYSPLKYIANALLKHQLVRTNYLSFYLDVG